MHGNRAALFELAESQYGVISRRQAIESGMRHRTVDYQVQCGQWCETLRGVYRMAGAPRSDDMALMAATLRVEGSALSHLTAAARTRLELRSPRHVDVAIGRTASGRRTKIEVGRDEREHWNLVIHRPQSLAAIDLMTVDGIRCTTAARTLIDVASMVDAESLECAYEAARRHRLVSFTHLERRVHELCGKGKPGSRAMYSLLQAHANDLRPADSRLEVRFARLLRKSGVAFPATQFPLTLPNGWRIRIDFAEPPLKLAAECEGFEFHGNRIRWKHDRRRTALLESMGWRVLVITWDDVTNAPEMTVQRVVDALAQSRRAA